MQLRTSRPSSSAALQPVQDAATETASVRLHINFSVVLPLFVRVAQELQSNYRAQTVSGFVYGKDSLKQLTDLGFPTSNVAVLSTHLAKQPRDAEPDMDYLRTKEEQYGIPNLYLMITACRFVSRFEHRRALKVLETGFRVLEQLFDDVKPDAVISDGVACTMSYIQYAIAQQRGIPFLTVAAARTNGRFYIIRNNTDRYERADALYERFKAEGIPSEVRERAERFVDEFRESGVKPRYFVQQAVAPRLNLEALKTLFEVSRRYVLHDRHNYILPTPVQAMLSRPRRILNMKLADRRHFERPRDGDRFVLYPLHDQPEMTTLVLGPFYLDQIALIENLAKSLPIDHLLYVKEHKASLGRRPLSYYRRIRRIPNVRLIEPYWDSHDLIKRSSAVAVISGTVGWEAILYERPVITFGEVFYNSFEGAYRAGALPDLPKLIKRAITTFQPDREALLRYVAAVLEGTYEGDAYYIPGARNSSVESSNVSRVAKALATELELVPGS